MVDSSRISFNVYSFSFILLVGIVYSIFCCTFDSTNKQKQNVMKNAQINTIAENKEFIAACAKFAKECGISAADWNANKGHFIGMILGMAKVHGLEF